MKELVRIFAQIEQEIYAPNEFGWEKFHQNHCAYFSDVDFRSSTWSAHEKVHKTIGFLFDRGLSQLNKEKNSSNIETLKLLKESIIVDIQKLLLSAYEQNSFYEEQFFKEELFQIIENYCSQDEKIKELGQKMDMTLISFIFSIFMQLKIIKSSNLLEKNYFIEQQRENFKNYIEPGAYKMVCYLLSQHNVNTYESHACSLYQKNGLPEYEAGGERKSIGAHMPNGVWFMLTHSNKTFEMETFSKHPTLLENGTRFYFAKLHKDQKETVFLPQNETLFCSFSTECLPLENNIYENEITALDKHNERAPSKRIQYNKPALNDLGFTHIEEMQIAPINQSNQADALPSLDEAIYIATEAVKAERSLSNDTIKLI